MSSPDGFMISVATIVLPDILDESMPVAKTYSKGEMDDVRAQLPAELDRLFEAGSTGHMSEAK